MKPYKHLFILLSFLLINIPLSAQYNSMMLGLGETKTKRFFGFYVKEFLPERFKYYKDLCSKKTKTTPVDTLTNSGTDSLFMDIHHKDQYYRKMETVDWTSQHNFDRSNRETLDSLYSDTLFKRLNSDSKLTIWLVLQHSTDCEWNEKWFVRYLDGVQNNQLPFGFMRETFDRFYNKEKGYCIEKSPQSSRDFLKKVKERYPDKILQLLELD